MMTNTLVLTSALNPVLGVPGVRITNPEKRLFQLCCSLLSWCEEPDIKNIIICDNTNPKYDFDHLQRVLEDHSKSSEILIFAGNQSGVEAKGKGYGEGEILCHIFSNSRLMQQSQYFYKATGRIYIKNFKVLHSLHKKSARVFDNPIPSHRRLAKRIAATINPNSRHGKGMVRTVFYKCDKKFFVNQLMERYVVVNDRSHFYLEHAYFFPLIRKGFSTFKEKPLIVGHSSSSGALYQDGNDYSDRIKVLARKLANSCLL